MAMRTTCLVQPFELKRKRLSPGRQEPAPSERGAMTRAPGNEDEGQQAPRAIPDLFALPMPPAMQTLPGGPLVVVPPMSLPGTETLAPLAALPGGGTSTPTDG